MEIKRGIAVAPGVAIGSALVLDAEGFRIPKRLVAESDIEAEVGRLRQALASAAREARDSQDAVTAKLGPQYGAIFGAHAVMLADPGLGREIETLVRSQHHAAEYAVSQVMRR